MIRPGMRLDEGDERTEILATPAETGDRYRLRLVLEPGAGPGLGRFALHTHPAFEEAFTCVAGRVMARLGRDRRELVPGDTLIVPERRPHGFLNTGDGPLTLDCDLIFSPPGPRREADLVEQGIILDALMRRRRARGQSPEPSVLEFAVLMRAYPLAMDFPAPVGRLVPLLAWLGRLRGHRPLSLEEALASGTS